MTPDDGRARRSAGPAGGSGAAGAERAAAGGGEVAGGGRPLPGVAVHRRGAAPRPGRGGRSGTRGREPRRVDGLPPVDLLRRSVLRPRAGAGEALEQHAGQAVDVAGRAAGLAGEPFRRHVGRAAEHHDRLGEPQLVRQARGRCRSRSGRRVRCGAGPGSAPAARCPASRPGGPAGCGAPRPARRPPTRRRRGSGPGAAGPRAARWRGRCRGRAASRCRGSGSRRRRRSGRCSGARPGRPARPPARSGRGSRGRCRTARTAPSGRRAAWSARRRRGRRRPCRRWRGGPAASSARRAHRSAAAPAPPAASAVQCGAPAGHTSLAGASGPGVRSLQQHARRGPTAGAEHAAAGMGGRAAQVQPVDRPAVAGQLGQRAPGEHAVQPHLDVHDVAPQQPELALQVERGLHVHVLDACRRSRGPRGRGRPPASRPPARGSRPSAAPPASSYGCHCPQIGDVVPAGRRDARVQVGERHPQRGGFPRRRPRRGSRRRRGAAPCGTGRPAPGRRCTSGRGVRVVRQGGGRQPDDHAEAVADPDGAAHPLLLGRRDRVAEQAVGGEDVAAGDDGVGGQPVAGVGAHRPRPGRPTTSIAGGAVAEADPAAVGLQPGPQRRGQRARAADRPSRGPGGAAACSSRRGRRWRPRWSAGRTGRPARTAPSSGARCRTGCRAARRRA